MEPPSTEEERDLPNLSFMLGVDIATQKQKLEKAEEAKQI